MAVAVRAGPGPEVDAGVRGVGRVRLDAPARPRAVAPVRASVGASDHAMAAACPAGDLQRPVPLAAGLRKAAGPSGAPQAFAKAATSPASRYSVRFAPNAPMRSSCSKTPTTSSLSGPMNSPFT